MKTINQFFRYFILFVSLSTLHCPLSTSYAQTAPVPTKSREFSIPFEVRADNVADPVREVELLYSLDHGIHWHAADRKSIEVGKFTYKANSDGEYWFAFRTITLSGITKQTGAASQIRVLVDSTPPKLSFTVTQQESGYLLVVWRAEDRNFQVKRPDFAVSVPSKFDEEKSWTSMNIDGRNVRVTESGLEGSFVFLPENGVSQIELRASISDIAGNRAEKTDSITIKPVHRDTELLPDAPVTTTTTTAPTTNLETPSKIVETTTFPGGSVPLAPPRPTRIRQQTKSPTPKPESPDKQVIESPEISEPLGTKQSIPILVSPDGKVAAIFSTDESSSTLVQNTLAEELLTNMGAFFDGGLQAEVSAIVKKPKTATTAATVAVPIKSSVAGSITGISLNTSANQPQIVVKWNIGDAPWSDAQIDIFRSATDAGPWQPIAINLRNSGEYWWFLTPDDLKPFYIMVRIRSLHGGVSSDTTQLPIKINPKSLNK